MGQGSQKDFRKLWRAVGVGAFTQPSVEEYPPARTVSLLSTGRGRFLR